MPKPRRVLSEERRRRILEWVEADGNVSTGALLEKLDVSPMTLWRDLSWLEQNSLIRRTRGGALSTNFHLAGFAGAPDQEDGMDNDPTSDDRRTLVARRAVARFVADGQTLILEDGPITRRMPPLLTHRELRLASSSLGMLALLCRRSSQHEIFSCGGTLDSELLAFRGPEAEAFFARLPADCCFLCAHGRLSASGLAGHSLQRMGQAMCRTARRCVLLAESNELERLDLRENGLAESVHAIVTDDGVSGEARERLQRHGVEIVASEPSVASA